MIITTQRHLDAVYRLLDLIKDYPEMLTILCAYNKNGWPRFDAETSKPIGKTFKRQWSPYKKLYKASINQVADEFGFRHCRADIIYLMRYVVGGGYEIRV